MPPALTFRLVVKDEGALAALEGAKRDLDRAVKAGLVRGAERGALPAVRRAAPRRSGALAGSMIAKATTRGVYITTNLRGKRRAVAGLLNYGGTVRTVIRPRRRRALRIAPGIFRAVVTTPRTYRAQRFIDRGIESVRERIAADLDHEVRAALEGGAQAILGDV